MVFGNGVKNIQAAAYNGPRRTAVCIKIKVSQFLEIFVMDNTNHSILVQFSQKNVLLQSFFNFLKQTLIFLTKNWTKVECLDLLLQYLKFEAFY